ncbi:DUF6080 domain-containing protein [Clostridium perfringens]|uniref:DUF6080 domain-containing protein n=1 Tax=Clostridium perfringens TaxID=1502 RepID=UPI001C854BA7|nr:DUF6080 domain-containing protein [Clostridium perfringens]
MKSFFYKYKNEVLVFSIIFILYLVISYVNFTKTTIFYNTNNTYDVLLDTDTGILFNWNTFAISQDNSKHILFSAIVSILAYPIYNISLFLSKNGLNYNGCYGGGLIFLQILVSAASITLIYNFMKTIKINKITLNLLTILITFSFPQLFMSLNIERFIYAQFSLVFYIFLVLKLKNKDSYLLDIAAIPLFGMTITNIYLYFFNLIFQFKFNIKKISKHILLFIFMLYICIIVTKSYNSFLNVSSVVQSDSQFILNISIIEKFKYIITRLLYPILYFPGYELVNNSIRQNSNVNIIFLIIVLIIFLIAILGGITNIKDNNVKLLMSIIGINIILHGIIGYNLLSANIMTIHFQFAVILLLAYFSINLKGNNISIFNIFLCLVIITVIISNVIGFSDILKLGMSIYPK